MKKEITLYRQRRQELIKKIQSAHPNHEGLIVLWGNFEHQRMRFRQESNVYYYTGLEEPGIVVTLDFSGKTIVYIPNYSIRREQWMTAGLIAGDTACAKNYGIDEICLLGAASKGYRFSPLFTRDEVHELVTILELNKTRDGVLFTLNSLRATELIDQKLVLERLVRMVPSLEGSFIDISPLTASMRRTKSKLEIELLYKAIEVTNQAHEMAAYMIEAEKTEAQVQAALEYCFIEHRARCAFPSIVASGNNATVLHYSENKGTLHKQDLVVVDIGAELNYYCADLTRTYPVAGTFSKRQWELYSYVLDAQELVASNAKPGYWLNNSEEPEHSLHHIAVNYFKEKNLDHYFIHGIGHFLGLDVHDVGDMREPLKEGDVITIEPGLYIKEESTGIRIEDNFWIIKDGALCLSENLPRHPDVIEEMVQVKREKEKNTKQ